MRILIGYGYFPGTTGIYIEKTLAKQHDVLFVGTGLGARAGYPPNLDIAQYVEALDDKPDLFVYVDSGNVACFPIGLERLGCPSVGYLVDAYPPGIAMRNPACEMMAPLFDHLFVAHRAAIPAYQHYRGQEDVFWLPVACDPEISPAHLTPRIYDIGFVGQYHSGYPERVRILDALSARYTMNDFHRPAYMEEMARVYSQSRIVVNISHTNQILNLRFFEATACQALLITDRSNTNGQNELLQEGRQFISFDTLEDLLEKVSYYLSHDEERLSIARSAQTEVLEHHTYAHRVQHMLDVIAGQRSATPARCAPCRNWTASQMNMHLTRLHSQLRLMDATFDNLRKQPGARSRLMQLYHVTQALMRRIKHEWK